MIKEFENVKGVAALGVKLQDYVAGKIDLTQDEENEIRKFCIENRELINFVKQYSQEMEEACINAGVEIPREISNKARAEIKGCTATFAEYIAAFKALSNLYPLDNLLVRGVRESLKMAEEHDIEWMIKHSPENFLLICC